MCFSQRNTKNIGQFSRKIFQKGLLSFLLYLHHIPKTSVFSSSKNFSFPAVWTSAYFSTFTPMSFQNCNPSKSISYRFIKTCFIIFPALCEHLLIQKESQVTFDTWQTFLSLILSESRAQQASPARPAFPCLPSYPDLQRRDSWVTGQRAALYLWSQERCFLMRGSALVRSGRWGSSSSGSPPLHP